MAGKSSWEVYKGNTVGSDYYPIFTDIGLECEIQSIIVHIGKPGKDQSLAESYRALALTPHVGKMVNKTLTYYIETKDLLKNYQRGFRKVHYRFCIYVSDY